jgi:K+-transporting ATPase KdpF subunit
LKTPLTSIRMAIHLLLEGKIGELTPKQEDLLMAAREDADRLYTILEELLDISRIESGRAQMDFRLLSLHSMVLEAVEPFRSAALDRGLTLSIDLPNDLPDVWVDMARITHVFANLLSNALKYTPAGGSISVSAQAERSLSALRSPTRESESPINTFRISSNSSSGLPIRRRRQGQALASRSQRKLLLPMVGRSVWTAARVWEALSVSLSNGQIKSQRRSSTHDRSDLHFNPNHFFRPMHIVCTGLWEALIMIDVIGGIIGLALIAYLFATILRPEKF